MAVAARPFVELHACGPDDPDGLRAATVLSAYFHAEHMKAFRRLLWQRIAIVAVIWCALALTPLFSGGAIAVGFILFGAVACGAALLEWNADKRLNALIADLPTSARVRSN